MNKYQSKLRMLHESGAVFLWTVFGEINVLKRIYFTAHYLILNGFVLYMKVFSKIFCAVKWESAASRFDY